MSSWRAISSVGSSSVPGSAGKGEVQPKCTPITTSARIQPALKSTGAKSVAKKRSRTCNAPAKIAARHTRTTKGITRTLSSSTGPQSLPSSVSSQATGTSSGR